MSGVVSVKQAIDVLCQSVQDDVDYAWVWHCNIAVCYQDEGASHEQANRAAARCMQVLFGVDVTVFPQWKAFSWATDEPLNFGELTNLADLYVTADHERNSLMEGSEMAVACDSCGLVAIYDAEMEIVCLVPTEKADLMARLINTYQTR